MLIKEYRIPMPLSVEEYRIAQLYMIQRKSRQESSGADSRVEILANEPYKNGPGGNGQYTRKVYHVGSHLPSWIRGILPKTALRVEEEAWNAYPYCRTKFTCPFMEKFVIDIETVYENDTGHQSNIFKLQGGEARRDVDYIDIVNDPCQDSRDEEDPKLYRSAETGRGPLKEDWLKKVDKSSVMCAYKLCRVEFRYWGMQTRVERFIHETALRKTMLTAHRQAWAWQDEWCHLNMDDIRRLEKETELALRSVDGAEDTTAATTAERTISEDDLDLEVEAQSTVSDLRSRMENDPDTSSLADSLAQRAEQRRIANVMAAVRKENSIDLNYSPDVDRRFSAVSAVSHRSSLDVRSNASSSLQSFSSAQRPQSSPTASSSTWTVDQRRRNSLKRTRSVKVNDLEAERMVGTAFSGMVETDSDSEDEFFDAKETVSDSDEELEILREKRKNLVFQESSNSFDDSSSEDDILDVVSNEVTGANATSGGARRLRTRPDPVVIVGEAACTLPHGPTSPRGIKSYHIGDGGAFSLPLPSVVTSPPSPLNTGVMACDGPSGIRRSPTDSLDGGGVQHLLLVFHGSQPLDLDHDIGTQQFNVNLLQANMASIAKTHYHQLVGRVAVRHVSCPTVTATALESVDLIVTHTTVRNTGATKPGQQQQCTDDRATTIGSGLLNMTPLLAVLHHQYPDSVNAVVNAANNVFLHFRQSEEGQLFQGEVSIVGDCMGAVLAYDALLRSAPSASRIGTRHPSESVGHRPRRHDHSTSPVSPPSTSRRQSLDHPDHGQSNIFSPVLVTFLFQVTHFFALGSPLGLVLAQRRLSQAPTTAGHLCAEFRGTGNFFNIIYESSLFSARIEPLLNPAFLSVPLKPIVQYRRFPYGDCVPDTLTECISAHPDLFGEEDSSSVPRLSSHVSMTSTNSSLPFSRGSRSGSGRMVASFDSGDTTVSKSAATWWGDKRIDYSLYAPIAVELLPDSAIPPFLHGSFWESDDVAAFITRQLVPATGNTIVNCGRETTPFAPRTPREKWQRKRTTFSVKGLSANHRGIDCVVNTQCEAVVSGKFMYGSIDFVTLYQEKVDLYVMRDPPCSEWLFLNTQVTERHGRTFFSVGPELGLTPNIYPFKMVVRGDHTQASGYLAVVPPNTAAVVFSVDGSFAASLSIMGADPRVHAGAVDVVRHWQDRNYLVIYITARPCMQKHRVVSWLAHHNFPHGLIFFSDGFSMEPQTRKSAVLKSLAKEAKLDIRCAYGSSKDKKVYADLGLEPHQIFVVGKRSLSLRASKKRSAQYITDGYAAHLDNLHLQASSAPANTSMVFRKQSFGLPPARKHHRAKPSTSGADISLSSSMSGGGFATAHRDSTAMARSTSRRRSLFKSRWATAKTPSFEVHGSAASSVVSSTSSLSKYRDRSNSDPAVPASSSATAVAATAASSAPPRTRKLTPPATFSGNHGAVRSHSLFPPPVAVSRCQSVPLGVLHDEGGSADSMTTADGVRSAGSADTGLDAENARLPGAAGGRRRSHKPVRSTEV